MGDDIKNELHKLIDNCDNELLLIETKKLLEEGSEVKDWWDELTEEDRNILLESEAEYEKGNFISNKELMRQFEAGKRDSVDFCCIERFLGYCFLFTTKLVRGSFR